MAAIPETNLKKQKKKLIIASVLLVLALALFLKNQKPEDLPGDTSQRTPKIYQAAVVLGQHLTKQSPHGKILLLTENKGSGDYREEIIDAARKGLLEGGNGTLRIEEIDSPKFSSSYLPPAQPGSPVTTGRAKWLPPMEFWLNTSALNIAINNNANCNFIVSLIGYPEKGELKLLEPSPTGGKRTLHILYGKLPGPERIADAVLHDAVDSVMLWRPRELPWFNREVMASQAKTDYLDYCYLLTKANITDATGYYSQEENKK